MLDDSDYNVKRFDIQSLVKNITVYRETIEIEFKVDARQNKNPIRTQSGILSD